MNSRLAFVEVKERNLKGNLSLYDSCSIKTPAYIVRAGGGREPLVSALRGKFGKAEGLFRVSLQLSKTDLAVSSAYVYRHPNDAPVAPETGIKIIEMIRKTLASHLNLPYISNTNVASLSTLGSRCKFARISKKKGK